MTDERSEGTSEREEFEQELEESTEGLRFLEDPESRKTGLILPEDIVRAEDRAEVMSLVEFQRMEAVVDPRLPAEGAKFWRNDNQPYVLDQENYESCTGGSAANHYNTAPVQHNEGNELMYELYDLATRFDPFSGYFDHTTMTQHGLGGSTMQAVARAMMELGYAREFVVTQDLETACRFLINHGPVLLGMRWGGCFRLDAEGYIHPDGTDGGHATLLRGIVRRVPHQVGPDRVRDKNQWGAGWGLPGGECRIRLDEIMRGQPTFVGVWE